MTSSRFFITFLESPDSGRHVHPLEMLAMQQAGKLAS